MNNELDADNETDDDQMHPMDRQLMFLSFQYREACLAHAIKTLPNANTQDILARARALFNFVWDDEKDDTDSITRN
jgi:hypothetical protein